MVCNKHKNIFINFAYAYSFVPVSFIKKIDLSSLCGINTFVKNKLINFITLCYPITFNKNETK